MTATAGSNRLPEQHGDDSFARGLQTLADEVRVAVEAMAANDLALLTESIQRQETLCGDLMLWPRSGGDREPRASQPGTRRASSTAGPVRAAFARLSGVTAEYHLVLEAAMRSAALLRSLYGGCIGYPEIAQTHRRDRGARYVATMSCEA